MIAITTVEYAESVWGGSITSKTVRNWIKAGRKLKGVHHVEVTPTGQYRLFMEEQQKSNTMTLLEMMRAKAA